MRNRRRPKRFYLLLAALIFIAAGILHFAKTSVYLKIMPPYIPWPLAMVQISGMCEILGGLGLLLPATRRLASWVLVALLIAVLPANIYMATNPVEAGSSAIPAVFLWLRLPLQFVLILWLLWCTELLPAKKRT